MSKSGTRAANGSGTLRADGYWQLRDPNHPTATKSGVLFVHRKVLYDSIGPGTHSCHYCGQSVEWMVDLEVDHKDRDKNNNTPENLVPCCRPCNRSRWNTDKTGCPHGHGPYDKQYKNGWRYCSKCKNEKEKRRRDRKKIKHIDDLLTDEEKQKLYDDLAEMAKQRRRAEAESAFIVMH